VLPFALSLSTLNLPLTLFRCAAAKGSGRWLA
jgi:hypothetical protein